MEVTALLYDLNASYGLELREASSIDALEAILAEKIGILIDKDFGALVQLLYRVDVSESRLRQLLLENRTTDAGRLIARLLLERQWQKIVTRREFSREKPKEDAADEEERW
jgi:hypothetical protein